MKKLLIALSIFALPIWGFAQNIQLSLLGGGSVPIMTGFNGDSRSVISPTASFKASYNFPSISVGVMADYGITAYKLKDAHYTYNQNTGFYEGEDIKVNYLNPALDLSAFAEKSFSTGVVSPFLGINAGFALSSPSEIIIPGENPKEYYSVNCFSVGLQFGIQVKLSKSFSIIAESSPKVLFPTINGDKAFFVIPLEAGVSLHM